MPDGVIHVDAVGVHDVLLADARLRELKRNRPSRGSQRR